MLVYQRVSYIILPLPRTLWGLLPGFFGPIIWMQIPRPEPSARWNDILIDEKLLKLREKQTSKQTNKRTNKQTNKQT